jgi:hypothetical protein
VKKKNNDQAYIVTEAGSTKLLIRRNHLSLMELRSFNFLCTPLVSKNLEITSFNDCTIFYFIYFFNSFLEVISKEEGLEV